MLGGRLIGSFQARLDASEPGGWNYYLELALNGRRLTALTANGTPRLLNRDLETEAFINNRLTALPYWGSSGGTDTSLLTFFGPGGSVLDSRVQKLPSPGKNIGRPVLAGRATTLGPKACAHSLTGRSQPTA